MILLSPHSHPQRQRSAGPTSYPSLRKNPKCKQWPIIALHSNEVIMTPQDFLLEMNKSHGIASAALQKKMSPPTPFYSRTKGLFLTFEFLGG